MAGRARAHAVWAAHATTRRAIAGFLSLNSSPVSVTSNVRNRFEPACARGWGADTERQKRAIFVWGRTICKTMGRISEPKFEIV